MKKTMTTNDVINAYNAVEEFTKKDIDLPKQAAWDLEDNIDEMKKVVEKFEKHRVEILQPLYDKEAFEHLENNQIRVKKEHEKAFIDATNEINQYLNTTNDLEIKCISREDIPDKISNKDLRALRFMIADTIKDTDTSTEE